MWRKTDGKPSPEVPQAPNGTTAVATKSPVTSEQPVADMSAPATPAIAAESPAPAPIPAATPAPVPAPRAAAAETPATAVATPAGASRIHPGLKINGEISGNTDLYVDGEVHGKIRIANARLVVGSNGKVRADIEAVAISIDGDVQGNLKASESVRLGPHCRVQGSIVTPRIGIEDGARLRSKVEMVKSTPAASTPSPEPVSSTALAVVAKPEVAKAVSASAKGE
ncbi:MAG TPA: polymer-forming cytoskeletal protein [Candidatus Aquilonibacter sp.]|nr:polymer-forming cytoskeletal protein [Candidatus Aquilonibacter sp.]